MRRKGPSKAQQAFQRGLAALAQWIEREGAHRPVPRGHSEQIAVDGETEPTIVELGVWISNTKPRRDKLTPEQGDALQELGIDWAGAAPAPATPAAPSRTEPPVQEHYGESDTTAEKEGEADAARSRARVKRMTELMRNHTKSGRTSVRVKAFLPPRRHGARLLSSRGGQVPPSLVEVWNFGSV